MSSRGDSLSGVSMVSFDVFDTLVIRRCGPPEALFLWMGRYLRARGVIRVDPEVYARARAAAEQALWRHHGGLDSGVGLAEIHAELARRLGWCTEDARLLHQIELELERRLARRNPVAGDLLDRMGRADRRTIVVSDTYLTAGELTALLASCDARPHHGVFTSHDAAKSKKSGRLYAHVREAVEEPPARILHVGDKPGVDVANARRAGWRARHLPEGQLDRHEELLAEARWESSGLSASLAGASREARLHTRTETAREAGMTRVTSSVGATLVIGYVLWVLHRARAAGLRRLAFLARDGQVLAAVARVLVERLDLGMEVVYLHVSRRSVNLAATWEIGPEDLGWTLRHAATRSVAEVLARVGVELDELAPVGLTAEDLVTGDVRTVLEALLRRPETQHLVRARAALRRETVWRYLEQQGLLGSADRCGLVDLGGVGSQVRALFELLVRGGAPAPAIYLLGLEQHPDTEVRAAIGESSWLAHTESWIYDEVRRLGEERYRGLVTLAHICCSANHPTVVDYREEAGVVVPVFGGQATATRLQSWGIEELHRTIVDVARSMELDRDLLDPNGDLRPVLRRAIEQLWQAPDPDEARAFGSFPFEPGELEASGARPLAAPYRLSEILEQLVRGRFPDRSWTRWHEASVMASPAAVRRVVGLLDATYHRLPEARRTWVRDRVRGIRSD